MNSIREEIQANIKGNVNGQIAIGSYILQIGNLNGGVVNFVQPSARPTIEQRARPINLKPRPFPSLLDRESETTAIRVALGEHAPVSLFGSGGVGKTTLLRRIAHLPETKHFPDGIVYLPVKDQGLEDLLQMLFDAFYSSSSDEKPTEVKIRHELQGIEALILLDDLTLERDDVESLLNLMPASMFVLASLKRVLWGDGRIIALPGLPNPMAVTLFERELGRSLTEDEAAAVKQIGSFLREHPMQILHAAALARDSGIPISRIWDQLRGKDPDVAIVQVSLDALDATQKRILEILATANGSVVPLQHLAVLSEAINVQTVLDSLKSLGLIQAHSPRYSLTAVMASSLATIWDLSTWEDRLIRHFFDWVMQSSAQELLEDSSDVLFQVIKNAGEKKRWKEVVRMGRKLEHLLIIKKRWQAWADILDLLLKAAQALGDRRLEAWVFHQLGSRALCLGLREKSHELLMKALHIRKTIGDKPGTAVTQHNLNILNGVPNPPRTKIKKKGGTGPSFGLFGIIVVLIAILGFGLASAGSLAPAVEPSRAPKETHKPMQLQNTAPASTDTLTPTRKVPPTPTRTSPPTRTPTRTHTLTPSIPCYLARFVQDVTVPDGTPVNPGASFTKIWRLKNEGSCAWNSSYKIVFINGDSMSAPNSSSWSGGVVQYGATVDISVKLLAPSNPGTYQGYFKLLAPDGTIFGLGVENKPFWVKIVVPVSVPITVTSNSPPPAPFMVSPMDGAVGDCSGTLMYFSWDEPYDASGIDSYEVAVDMYDKNSGTWINMIYKISYKNYIDIPLNNICGSLRWRVRAKDYDNAWGSWSQWIHFSTQWIG